VLVSSRPRRGQVRLLKVVSGDPSPLSIYLTTNFWLQRATKDALRPVVFPIFCKVRVSSIPYFPPDQRGTGTMDPSTSGIAAQELILIAVAALTVWIVFAWLHTGAR
jgi:hypothetical protein